MTLDELLEKLHALRDELPSTGDATIAVKFWQGIDWDVRYDNGEVWLFDDEMTEADDPDPTRDYAIDMLQYYAEIIEDLDEEARQEALRPKKQPISIEAVRAMLRVVRGGK